MKKLIPLLGIMVFGAALFGAYFYLCWSDSCLVFNWQKARATENFSQCEARGFPVSGSDPRECKAGSKVFLEPPAAQGAVKENFDPITGETDLKISGIKGEVLLGPTCPVMRIPPEPGCEDRPYSGKFNIYDEVNNFVKAFSSKDDGTFSAILPPGRYVIVPDISGIFPHGSPQTVQVEKGQLTQVSINLDTGIR